MLGSDPGSCHGIVATKHGPKIYDTSSRLQAHFFFSSLDVFAEKLLILTWF